MNIETILRIYVNNLLLGFLAWFAAYNLGFSCNYFDVTIAVTAFMAMALPPDIGPNPPPKRNVILGWSKNRLLFIMLAFAFTLVHLTLNWVLLCLVETLSVK